MRYFLVLVMLCAYSLTASAQWWRLDFKKHARYPMISRVKDNSLTRMKATSNTVNTDCIDHLPYIPSQYQLEVKERIVMRAAQHSMRFREYGPASYRFSELAQIYVKENRLSEAKWYYLQSNLISRQQNDHQHTISNLVNLAMVKADLGDMTQAQQDLTEARELARANGRPQDIKFIEEKMKFLQTNKNWLPKSELRYADAAEVTAKSK